MRPARFGTLVWLCGTAALARGDAVDALRSDNVVDPIGVARVADEAGDAVLAEYLAQSSPRDLVLVATRAAPHAHEPERLVRALVALALGRDPQLAPEAAGALLAIAEGLRLSELAAREALTGELATARAALSAVREAPTPRADIAFAVARLDAALDAMGAPKPSD